MAAEVPLVAGILETLDARDPRGQTVVVGGAAIVLQMHAAGLEVPSTKDVDTLCSQEFFDEQLLLGPHYPDVQAFHANWPDAVIRSQGVETQAVHILPDKTRFPRQLRFTTCTELGSRALVLQTYEEVAANPGTLVEVDGVRCTPIADILERKAIIGRKKDLAAVWNLVPVVHEAGLVTDEQRDRIMAERAESKRAQREGKDKNQNRYYARVPASDLRRINREA